MWLLLQPFPARHEQDLVIVQKEIKVKRNREPIVYPPGMEDVTYCEPFSTVSKRKLGKDFTLSFDARVTILAPALQIVVTQYPNLPKITYLPIQTGRQLLYPSSIENDGFLGVQGDKDEILNFLNSKVQICGTADKNKISIDTYKLPAPRLLFQGHQHKPEAATQGFSPEQLNFVKNLQFTNLELKVRSIKDNTPIKDAILYFYHKEDDCGKLSAIPYRMIEMSTEERLFNLVKKVYFFGIERRGYYLYCSKLDVSKAKELDVSLIPRNQVKGQFSVVMETFPQEHFELVLGASMPECQVGFFNENCGGIKFYGSPNAQAISVDELAERKYTFFVQFIPKQASLAKLNQEKADGKTIDASSINNDQIFDVIRPIVTLYAQEQERPIARYQIPQQKTQVHNEPNLTWLVLCVDGEIGDISQKSPATFWTYAANPSQYQRPEKSKLIYPNVCTPPSSA